MFSVKLSCNIGDTWHEVDRTSSDEKSWLSRKRLAGNLIDGIGGDCVNFVAVLVEGEVSEGLEVTGNFLEALFLVFHSKEHIHLENVLSSGELLLWDWFAEGVQLFDQDVHQLSRV